MTPTEEKKAKLDRSHNGERVTEVAVFYSTNEATIGILSKTNVDSVRKRVAAGSSTSLSTASHVRDAAMENMEKAFIISPEGNHSYVDSN
ncbi:hypothetical protein CEXT_351291 [Caerostris extrusa]|uniref:Uncharacterized protein n=1 Tax=Caerostris extrusa TaxID=172846 RepID=A0AAV4SFW9_CAEEX|nr:hypothetical protein CEXT_351291 [Caerostris extrusa]